MCLPTLPQPPPHPIETTASKITTSYKQAIYACPLYLQHYSFHYHRLCWPTSIQYLPVNRATACLYDAPRTHDVGLPT